VKQFHACINNAKVIKLPSHCSNIIWSPKSKQKKEMETGAPVSGHWRRLQRWCGYFDSVAFCFWRCWGRSQRWYWFDCFLSITNGSVINWFLAGTKTGYPWSSTFLSFSVYLFFFTKACFLQGRNLGWCDVSVLDSVFFFLGGLCFLCSVFSFGLIALFFWVFWLLLGVVGCSISRFLLFFFFFCLRSLPSFYRDPQLAPNQSCLCKTVSSTNEIVGKGCGPRLELLQIFRSPVESGWRRSHGSPTSNGDVSAKRHIFTFWPLNFGNPAIGPLSN